MDQNNGYSVPDFGAYQPQKGRYRYVFLGILFPIIHFVIMFFVQMVTAFFITLHMMAKEGIHTPQDDILKKVTEIYSRHSDWLSILTGVITILITVMVFLIIRSRLKTRAMIPPTAKEYFSLQKVSAGLLFKVALLAFFFYHLVLGFLNLVGLLVPELMQSYNDASQSIEPDTGVVPLILSFISLVIMAPLTEELVYRNMAVSNMRNSMPTALAIVISSLIFGLAHGNPIWIVYAMGLGFVFGFLYVWSDSIFVSITAHVVFNLIGYLYSVLGSLLAKDAFVLLNHVSLILIVISLAGVPLTFWWVYSSLAKKRKSL